MLTVLLARKAEFFRLLFEGNPIAIICLLFAFVVALLVVWLAFAIQKRIGRKLAEAVGNCSYTFAPDGLFGPRLWVISGTRGDLPFTLFAEKVARGDQRSYLVVKKPITVDWDDIRAELRRSLAGVEAANDVTEEPESVTLEYLGIGGDPKFVVEFLDEVSAAVQNRVVRR